VAQFASRTLTSTHGNRCFASVEVLQVFAHELEHFRFCCQINVPLNPPFSAQAKSAHSAHHLPCLELYCARGEISMIRRSVLVITAIPEIAAVPASLDWDVRAAVPLIEMLLVARLRRH
jgi:hypothetical protein